MSQELKDIIEERYGRAARAAASGAKAGCCGSGPAQAAADPITSNLYSSGETTRPRSPLCAPARRSSTSARGAASTSSSPRAASGPKARSTAST